MTPTRSFSMSYEFSNKGKKYGELLIYDRIGEDFWGDGVSPKQFAKDLKDLGDIDELDVRINSAGGYVTDAAAIYNQIHQHKATVTVYIDGMALSAASVIAMAGDEIRMAENAIVMIHDPRGIAMGDAKEMRKHADVLDTMRDTIASTYIARTGQSREDINQMMADETWMDAEEAKEKGFVDTVIEAKTKAAAKVDVRNIFNVPERFRNNFELTQPGNPPANRKGKNMSGTDTVMPAADYAKANPDAVKNWSEEGFKKGHDEATKEQTERAKALAEAFKDRPAFALEQYLKGNDVSRAKAELADVLITENKKLAEDLKTEKNKTPGQNTVATTSSQPDDKNLEADGKYQDMEIKDQIEAEWRDNHNKCQDKYKVQSAYAALRRRQLNRAADSDK